MFSRYSFMTSGARCPLLKFGETKTFSFHLFLLSCSSCYNHALKRHVGYDVLFVVWWDSNKLFLSFPSLYFTMLWSCLRNPGSQHFNFISSMSLDYLLHASPLFVLEYCLVFRLINKYYWYSSYDDLYGVLFSNDVFLQQ